MTHSAMDEAIICRKDMLKNLEIAPAIKDRFTVEDLKQIVRFRRMDEAAMDKWLADRNAVATGLEAPFNSTEPAGFPSLESLCHRLHFQYFNHPDPARIRPGSRAKNRAHLEQIVWQTVATSLIPGGGGATLLFLLSKRATLATLRSLGPSLAATDTKANLHYVANIMGVSPDYDGELDKSRLDTLRIPPTYRWYFAPVHPDALITYLSRWLECYGTDPLAWVLDGCPPVEDTGAARAAITRLNDVQGWGNTNKALQAVVKARLDQINKRKAACENNADTAD